MKWAVLLGWAAASLAGQSIQVYSEFAQLNDAGKWRRPKARAKFFLRRWRATPSVRFNWRSRFRVA